MSLRTLILILSLVPIALSAAPDPAESQPAAPSRKKGTPAKRRAPRTPEQLVEAYMPKVKSALAARWAGAVTPHLSEFTSGNLTVNFKLDADGKVAGVAVTANTANEPLAKFCDQLLRDTKFEPPPAGALVDGQLEIPFTFTIY